jgi:hypothetical protein
MCGVTVAGRGAEIPRLQTFRNLPEPVKKRSPERLETAATYTSELAAWKRHQSQRERKARRTANPVDEADRDE